MNTNTTKINYGITGVDVRREAMEAIQRIKSGQMDVKEAQAIKGLLDVVVDVAKTQVAFIQSLPNTVKEQMSVTEVKAIAGTLMDRDAEVEVCMAEIEESRKKPYQDLQ